MILVLADDLTGAAEIAAMAWELDAGVALSRDARSLAPLTSAEVVVVDTDSREQEAEVAAGLARQSLELAMRLLSPRHLFKKIDSACRGPVGAEVEAALVASGRRSALLVPASPATDRRTIGGVHSVGGLPIAQTEFASDLAGPGAVSHLPTLLGHQTSLPVRGAARPSDADLAMPGITVGDGETDADLAAWAHRVPDDVLAVGSAAFGASLLERWLGEGEHGSVPRLRRRREWPPVGLPVLIVNGSRAAASARQEREYARAGGCVVAPGRDTEATAEVAADALTQSGAVLLTSSQWRLGDASGSDADPSRLLAKVVMEVMSRRRPATIVVSGGHTAERLLDALQWSALTVTGQFDQGIVALRPLRADGPMLALKPGSYGGADLYARLSGLTPVTRRAS